MWRCCVEGCTARGGLTAHCHSGQRLALAVGGSALALWGVVARCRAVPGTPCGGDRRADQLDLHLRRHAEGEAHPPAAGLAWPCSPVGTPRHSAATIDHVATQLERNGRIPVVIGLGLQPVRAEDDGAAGAIIVASTERTRGGIGLHQGDVVVSWDGQPLSDVAALRPRPDGVE